MASPKYKLNKEDGLKILTGLGIAVGGAVLTYLAELIPDVDFGSMTPVVVALSSVLINAGRKWLKNNS
jgi:hypothetical protein